MHSFGICALAALFGAAAAAPVNKRDLVIVTDVEVVTVPVTVTVWVDESGSTSTAEAVPTAAAAYSSPSAYSAPAAATTSSVYSAPAATSSSSVYVASSTSAYVAQPTSSSSAYVASTTSSYSAYVPSTTEAPTSTYVASTSSTAAATTSASSSSSGGTYTDVDLTYYTPGMGSCGETSGLDDPIVALSHVAMTADWSGNPNDNPLCNRAISITYNGVTKSATIVDTCEGCEGPDDLDLSQGLFSEFADTSVGRLKGASWSFT